MTVNMTIDNLHEQSVPPVISHIYKKPFILIQTDKIINTLRKLKTLHRLHRYISGQSLLKINSI